MKCPILVVLAAGMGSRYGGLKQMDKIGKHGEVLLDFSVFDAVKSGYEKIVFIIRRDIEKDFRESVLARMDSKVKWDLAFQEADSLIPPDIFRAAKEAGRTKPWGTSHALLCAAQKIDAPFTVINADDFYGRDAFAVMGKYLGSQETSGGNFQSTSIPAIVPYRLKNTLSTQGTVARGICRVEDGYLVDVEELTAIEEKDGRIINTGADGAVRELMPETPVSMNFWGFPPAILPELKKYFDHFLKGFAADIENQIKSECFIPKAVDYFIKQGIIKVKVLSANSDWFGVTYKEDRDAAIIKIEELTAKGVYPSPLW